MHHNLRLHAFDYHYLRVDERLANTVAYFMYRLIAIAADELAYGGLAREALERSGKMHPRSGCGDQRGEQLLSQQ